MPVIVSMCIVCDIHSLYVKCVCRCLDALCPSQTICYAPAAVPCVYRDFTVHYWLLVNLWLSLCASCITNMSGANPLHPTPSSSIMHCTPCGNTRLCTQPGIPSPNPLRPHIYCRMVCNMLSYPNLSNHF